MEFDELLITTGVDALVRLIKEKQRIELEDASSILNIPQETIEDWARVLEEEGILRIEYRLTRIFLVWVRPTEEEIAQEKESFYQEKASIEGEVGGIKGKIGAEAQEIEDLRQSFDKFYSKVYGRMDELEKMLSPVPAGKTLSDESISKFREDLGGMEGQLAEVRKGIGGIRTEVDSLGVGGKAGGSEELVQKAERMNEDLAALQADLEALRKRAASQEGPDDVSMPSVKDIRKKFEGMQKDLSALRSRNAQMRQDMLSLHESSEILKSVAESIMGQEDKIAALRGEVEAVAKEADELMSKSSAVAAQVKQNADLIGRLGDSVDVAKAVLKKFPSQQKVLDDLDKLRAEEEGLGEKVDAMEKLLEAVGGRQVTAKQFAELTRRMEEKSAQMRKDLDSLEATLHDEKSTYLTFQKIKERIVPSIEAYQAQLDAMDKKIQKIRADSAAQMETLKGDAMRLQESLKGGQVQDVLKIAEEIRGKKKSLDDIRASLDDLASVSDNLNKRVTLLSREAKLLEIRTGGAGGGSAPASGGGEGGGGGEPQEKTVRQKLELTETEEMEFRRKREELKKLIQRLWEE